MYLEMDLDLRGYTLNIDWLRKSLWMGVCSNAPKTYHLFSVYRDGIDCILFNMVIEYNRTEHYFRVHLSSGECRGDINIIRYSDGECDKYYYPSDYWSSDKMEDVGCFLDELSSQLSECYGVCIVNC